MNSEFQKQFEALLSKYTELLLGESNPELDEKVKMWALYSHISKSMPALTKHWNELYPEGKNEVMSLIGEIKTLNEKHRQKSKK